MATLTAKRVKASSDALLSPSAPQWSEAPAVAIALEPSPIDTQTSDYVIAKWTVQPYGAVTEVRVRQIHNDEAIFFLLEWDDAEPNTEITDIDVFTDGAAVIFPVKEDAVLLNMGDEQQPVNAWYWRPDFERPWSVTAQGLGTTVRAQEPALAAGSDWNDGVWRVVIARRFQATRPAEEVVALSPGISHKVSFGVWQGSNQERGGLKAISSEWHQLNIEP